MVYYMLNKFHLNDIKFVERRFILWTVKSIEIYFFFFYENFTKQNHSAVKNSVPNILQFAF